MAKTCQCLIPITGLSCKGCPNEETNNLTYDFPQDDYSKAREYDRLVEFFSSLQNASKDAQWKEVK
jgi:hypothetical protein